MQDLYLGDKLDDSPQGRVTKRKIMADVLRGLCAFHQHELSHFDVKMENVVWDGAVARLIDFDFVESWTDSRAKPWHPPGSILYLNRSFAPGASGDMHSMDIFAAGAMSRRALALAVNFQVNRYRNQLNFGR